MHWKLNLNFYSSLLFIIPVIYSLLYNCIYIFYGAFSVLLLSIIYHSTYYKIIKIIDIANSNFNIIYYLYFCMNLDIYYLLVLCLFLIVSYLYIKYSSSQYGIYTHSLLHFTACIAIVLLIISCSNNNNCSCCIH